MIRLSSRPLLLRSTAVRRRRRNSRGSRRAGRCCCLRQPKGRPLFTVKCQQQGKGHSPISWVTQKSLLPACACRCRARQGATRSGRGKACRRFPPDRACPGVTCSETHAQIGYGPVPAPRANPGVRPQRRGGGSHAHHESGGDRPVDGAVDDGRRPARATATASLGGPAGLNLEGSNCALSRGALRWPPAALSRRPATGLFPQNGVPRPGPGLVRQERPLPPAASLGSVAHKMARRQATGVSSASKGAGCYARGTVQPLPCRVPSRRRASILALRCPSLSISL